MNDSSGQFLSVEEKKLLLQIARETLRTHVTRGQRHDLASYPLTTSLKEKCGAFVTLRRGSQLRGCIGYTKGVTPLAETVRDNAINAAARDPRFKPVTAEELDDLTIEISALCPGDEPGSPFILVNDISNILLGRDGLYLESKNPYGAGLLLPQVPVEQGWDLSQFLSGLCYKAGLPDRAWERPGAKLYRFSAQVFSEKEELRGLPPETETGRVTQTA
jgi:AmmeMemoRadiSam system protein A